MRKSYLFIIAIVVMVLALGCASASRMKSPAWISELPPQNEIWGIGFAKLEDQNLAWQTATARAQRSAAEQIGVTVQAMLTDYANTEGLASNPRAVIAIENVQRNIVNMDLRGASVNKREQMSDGTWWMRVSVNKADALREVNNIVNNEFSDYAQFRADQALRQLDFELNKSNPALFIQE